MITIDEFLKELNNINPYINIMFKFGDCYKLSKLLCKMYPGAEPVLNVDANHVYTRYKGKLYDIDGVTKPPRLTRVIGKQEIELMESWSFFNKWKGIWRMIKIRLKRRKTK